MTPAWIAFVIAVSIISLVGLVLAFRLPPRKDRHNHC